MPKNCNNLPQSSKAENEEKTKESSTLTSQHGVNKKRNQFYWHMPSDMSNHQMLIRQAIICNSILNAQGATTTWLCEPDAMVINVKGKTGPVKLPQKAETQATAARLSQTGTMAMDINEKETQAAGARSSQTGVMAMDINEKGETVSVKLPIKPETQAAAARSSQTEAKAMVINKKGKTVPVKLPKRRESQAGTTTESMAKNEEALTKTIPKRLCRSKLPQPSGNSSVTYARSGFHQGPPCQNSIALNPSTSRNLLFLRGNPRGEVISAASIRRLDNFSQLTAHNSYVGIGSGYQESKRFQGSTPGKNVPAPMPFEELFYKSPSADKVASSPSMSTECSGLNPRDLLNSNTSSGNPTTPFDIQNLRNAIVNVEKRVGALPDSLPLNRASRRSAYNNLLAAIRKRQFKSKY